MAEPQASPAAQLQRISSRIVRCRACPRLVAHREQVGRVKRRAYLTEFYWARPVPSFGDAEARLLVVGLAPAAHGANRTGRMFTGDSSGDWLYRALHRGGFANRAGARSAGDGLALRGAYITAAAHCAPPDNRPTTAELETCRSFLAAELEVFLARTGTDRPLVVLALGGVAHAAILASLSSVGCALPRPKPRFAHSAVTRIADGAVVLVDSYHPSRQNTQTGRLTEPMLDDVVALATTILAGSARSSGGRMIDGP